MKTPAVKGLFAAAAAVVLAAFPMNGRGMTIDVTKVQQRYPWNGLVDIDYTITADEDDELGADDNLEVLMIDKAVMPPVTNRAVRFLPPALPQPLLPMTAGKHRITWDASADGVTGRTDTAEFQVKVVRYAANYMVIDISKGATAPYYPVEFLTVSPDEGESASAVFNTDDCKTRKLVLRRIHPGSYVAGSPSDEFGYTQARELQHRVIISKPFYIGIFEVTQAQYTNVVNEANPSGTDGQYFGGIGERFPVNKVAVETHIKAKFIANLLQKCRSRNSVTGEYDEPVTGFGLPTEFQWEYACRAGTTKAFNLTDDFDNTSEAAQEEQLAKIGRWDPSAGFAVVGSYLPNAWGLYDMHGNVYEFCSDRGVKSYAEGQLDVDPFPPTGGQWNMRGGCFADARVTSCRSALRASVSSAQNYAGFRLIVDLP